MGFQRVWGLGYCPLLIILLSLLVGAVSQHLFFYSLYVYFWHFIVFWLELFCLSFAFVVRVKEMWINVIVAIVLTIAFLTFKCRVTIVIFNMLLYVNPFHNGSTILACNDNYAVNFHEYYGVLHVAVVVWLGILICPSYHEKCVYEPSNGLLIKEFAKVSI